GCSRGSPTGRPNSSWRHVAQPVARCARTSSEATASRAPAAYSASRGRTSSCVTWHSILRGVAGRHRRYYGTNDDPMRDPNRAVRHAPGAYDMTGFSCTARGEPAIAARAMRMMNASTRTGEPSGRGFETIADTIMYRWSAERDVWVSDEEVEQARVY